MKKRSENNNIEDPSRGVSPARTNHTREISDRDERLLSMFVDGELPEGETATVRARLASEPELALHLQWLLLLRTEVSGAIQAKMAESAPALAAESNGLERATARRETMWQRIEAELRPEAVRGHRGPISLWERLFGRMRVSSFAISLGTAALVFLVTGPNAKAPLVRNGNSGMRVASASKAGLRALSAEEASQFAREPGDTDQLILSQTLSMNPTETEVAGNELPEIPAFAPAAQPQQDLLARVGIDDIQPTLTIDTGVPEDLVGRLMPSSEVASVGRTPAISPADRDQFDGGYRAGGGVDIAWIRSERPVRLVSTKRESSAPVVWVSRMTAHR